MDMYKAEDTISLWDENKRKNIILKDLQTGKSYSFLLKRSLIVGRSEVKSDLQITTCDKYISGKHLRFLNDESGVYVEDLNSTNGTRVNGRLISTKTRIKRGDILKMGRTEFSVVL